MTPPTIPRTGMARSFTRSGGIPGVAGSSRLRRAGLPLRRHDLDSAAFVVGTPDIALALKVGEMLVNRGERLEAELAGDFLEARGVALGLDVGRDEVEDFALAACERHQESRK